jgi:hypothetical protein
MSEAEMTEEESMGVKSIAHLLPCPHVPMLSSHGQSAIRRERERLEGRTKIISNHYPWYPWYRTSCTWYYILVVMIIPIVNFE